MSELDTWTVPQGTEEETRRLVGTTGPVRFAAHPVNTAMIKHYCALVQDANPHYWEPATGVSHWGGEISPPGMTMVWLQPLQWTPEGGEPRGSLSMAPNLPLPATSMINVSTETTFHRPVLRGMHLNVVEELVSLSDRKETRLGPGYFVATKVTYRTQGGTTVATSRNVLLRYTPEESL